MEKKNDEVADAKWIKASRGSLPPMAILEVDDEIEGNVDTVDLVERERIVKVKGKPKTEIEERLYYRITLSKDSEVSTGKKQKDGTYARTTFTAGQVVSLPGAGGLDSTMRGIALKLSGLDPKDHEADADFKKLEGLSVRVKRMADEVMKKGEFEGNKVKVYDVDYMS